MRSQGDVVRGRTLRSRMRHCIRREHSRVPYYQHSYRLPTRRHENFWQEPHNRYPQGHQILCFKNTLTDASCSGTAPARKKVGPSTSESTPSQSNKCLQPTQSLAKRLRSSVAKKLISQWQMYFQATDWKGATIPRSHRQWRGSHRPILCQILRTLSITVCQSHSYDHGEYRQRFFPNEPKTCRNERAYYVQLSPVWQRLIDTSLQSHLTFYGTILAHFAFKTTSLSYICTFLTAHSTCSSSLYSTFSYCSCPPPFLLFFGFSHLSLFKKKSLPQWNKVLATSGITQNTLLTTAFQIATGSLTL